jgi:hypothetical protein
MKNSKTIYVITVVVFILVGAICFLTFWAQKTVTGMVNTKTGELYQLVLDAGPGTVLTNEGYDITALPQAFDEFEASIPRTLGLDDGASGLFIDRVYQDLLDKTLGIVRGQLDGAATVFSGDGNRVTLSSITNGVRILILDWFNRIVFLIRMVLLAISLVLLFLCIYTSLEGRKKRSVRS